MAIITAQLRSNATLQIPDPTKIIESANENSANQNAGRAFPNNIDSFISWSNSSKLTKQKFGFLKANKRRNKNRNNLEIAFYEARPVEGEVLMDLVAIQMVHQCR